MVPLRLVDAALHGVERPAGEKRPADGILLADALQLTDGV